MVSFPRGAGCRRAVFVVSRPLLELFRPSPRPYLLTYSSPTLKLRAGHDSQLFCPHFGGTECFRRARHTAAFVEGENDDRFGRAQNWAAFAFKCARRVSMPPIRNDAPGRKLSTLSARTYSNGNARVWQWPIRLRSAAYFLWRGFTKV